jgi:hypothetical protein
MTQLTVNQHMLEEIPQEILAALLSFSDKTSCSHQKYLMLATDDVHWWCTY